MDAFSISKKKKEKISAPFGWQRYTVAPNSGPNEYSSINAFDELQRLIRVKLANVLKPEDSFLNR
jgi:hypothetical protein